jgi:hypothetical protein
VTDLVWRVTTVKLAALVAVPPGVVTLICPLVAPVGTVAVIWMAELTVNVAFTLLVNRTDVVVKPEPLKFVPAITTDVPIDPEAGANDVIVGAGAFVTLKLFELVAVPSAFRTLIGPSVALFGTVAVIVVSFTTVKDWALWPLNSTSFTGGVLKLFPVMVTRVPTGPLVGENEVIVGFAAQAGVTPSIPTSNAVRTATADSLVVSFRGNACIVRTLPLVRRAVLLPRPTS